MLCRVLKQLVLELCWPGLGFVTRDADFGSIDESKLLQSLTLCSGWGLRPYCVKLVSVFAPFFAPRNSRSSQLWLFSQSGLGVAGQAPRRWC